MIALRAQLSPSRVACKLTSKIILDHLEELKFNVEEKFNHKGHGKAISKPKLSEIKREEQGFAPNSFP